MVDDIHDFVDVVVGEVFVIMAGPSCVPLVASVSFVAERPSSSLCTIYLKHPRSTNATYAVYVVGNSKLVLQQEDADFRVKQVLLTHLRNRPVCVRNLRADVRCGWLRESHRLWGRRAMLRRGCIVIAIPARYRVSFSTQKVMPWRILLMVLGWTFFAGQSDLRHVT